MLLLMSLSCKESVSSFHLIVVEGRLVVHCRPLGFLAWKINVAQHDGRCLECLHRSSLSRGLLWSRHHSKGVGSAHGVGAGYLSHASLNAGGTAILV